MFKLKGLSIFSILVIAFLYSSIIFATEQTIATITNDQDKDTTLLIVNTDAGGNSIKGFFKDTFTNGKRVLRESFNAAKISGGIVRVRSGSHTVLQLLSDNFDPGQGGIIQIDTLLNGAKGSRKSYEVSIAKSKTAWALFKDNKEIKTMAVVSNKVKIFGVVGIKNIIIK